MPGSVLMLVLAVEVLIPVEVDYSEPFEGSNHKCWDQEFKENVHEEVFERTARGSQQDIFGNDMLPYDVIEDT